MEEVILLNKVNSFLNKDVVWTPVDFPEDMEDESIINDLVSEGTDLYYDLKEAKDLIEELKSLVLSKS